MSSTAYFNQTYTKFLEKYEVRSYLWYVGWPVAFFIILAPGFLISLPPAESVTDGVKRPIAPGRVIWQAVLIHAAVFTFLVMLMFFLGAQMNIPFPHYVHLNLSGNSMP
jgi:hypothetical protein